MSATSPIVVPCFFMYSRSGRPIINRMISPALTFAMVSVATRLPSRKMVTRSHSIRTSSRRCEMKTMVRPSSRSRRAMPNRVSTSLGVSGAVGSSMMIRRLSDASARAISTICWSAIERPRMGRVTSILTPSRSISWRASPVILAQCTRPSGAPPVRPRTRFSATERSGKEIGSWWISVMPSFCAAMGEWISTVSPLSAMVPRLGRCTPARILAKVDLPAPFSPSRAWISPRKRSRSTSRSTSTPAKDFEMPLAAISGVSVAGSGMLIVRPARVRRDRSTSAP